MCSGVVCRVVVPDEYLFRFGCWIEVIAKKFESVVIKFGFTIAGDKESATKSEQ